MDFDLTEKSLEEDFRAIRRCRRFMMIYPSKVASSVLVEAGYALAAGKPSTYFVRDSHDLPFILRGAVMAEGVDVKMYEFTDHDDLRAKICKVAKEFGKD